VELSTPPLIATATVAAAAVELAADWGAIGRSESDGGAVSWLKGAQAGVPVPLEGDGAALAEEFAIVEFSGFRKVVVIGLSPLWLSAATTREGELQPLGWQRSRSQFLQRWFGGPG
jgi:hypothetical protein